MTLTFHTTPTPLFAEFVEHPVTLQVPRSCQCILMSATISDDVERLQKLVLHNPITLNLLHTNAAAAPGAPGAAPTALSQGSGVSASIEHFAVVCAKEDRLLYVMATLKLGLLRKKVGLLDFSFKLWPGRSILGMCSCCMSWQRWVCS